MPYLLFFKKQLNLKLSSDANNRWPFKGLISKPVAVLFNISVDPDDTDPDSMLVYPRFCMVKKDDHKHAAFYPPLTRKRHEEEEFSREIISEFVKDYLANPKKLLEDTDQF